MHPIFLARGPAFKQGHHTPVQFNSVDIYPLLCHILDVAPAPHDGSLQNVNHMLAADHEDEEDEGFFTTTMLTCKWTHYKQLIEGYNPVLCNYVFITISS